MRSLPRRRRAARGSAGAADSQPAARFYSGRNPDTARDGASHARCFHLRSRADRVERDRICTESLEPLFMSEQLAPSPLIPVPRGPVPQAPPARSRASVEITIDGRTVPVKEGATLLDATRSLGIDTPTLCYLETL